jgi:hypothetical protein
MTSEENNYNNEEESGRSWPKWWIAFPVLLILALASNGFLYYKYYKTTHNKDGKSYEEQYKEIVGKYNTEKADLNRELSEIKLQLEQATLNNSSLMSFNDSLKIMLDAKTMEIARRIQSSGAGNPGALRRAQADIEKLKELQRLLESQKDSLSQSNHELITKILETEASFNEAKNKSKMLEDQKNLVDEKIKNSALNVADLRVVGIRQKGAKEEETYKASRVNKLYISFTVLANELIAAGDKDISIRIIGTANEVLTEDNPDLTDSEKLTTMKKTINYQNDQLKVNYTYTQKATYKKGTYIIELHNNDKLMGRGSFILK